VESALTLTRSGRDGDLRTFWFVTSQTTISAAQSIPAGTFTAPDGADGGEVQ